MLTVALVMFRQLQLLAEAVVAAERRGEFFAVRRTLQRIDRGELSFSDAAVYLRNISVTSRADPKPLGDCASSRIPPAEPIEPNRPVISFSAQAREDTSEAAPCRQGAGSYALHVPQDVLRPRRHAISTPEGR